MNWHQRIAWEMGVRHSDTVAVVRWGKKAKRATRRRIRRIGKRIVKDTKDSDVFSMRR